MSTTTAPEHDYDTLRQLLSLIHTGALAPQVERPILRDRMKNTNQRKIQVVRV